MNTVPQWVVLSRQDCSLCETLIEELVGLLGGRADQVQVQDIGGDADLERKYGQRIPVLFVDGEFVCAYRLDHDRLQAYLSG
ncbi:MAG: glutaredoxin family protein [Steroidobacteraceae bacterium]